MGNYDWTTVLITGGAGGIGRALAELFLEKGKTVIIAGRTEAKLRATADALAHPALSYTVLDVGDLPALPAAAAALAAAHPALDCVVHNAGVQRVIDFAAAGLDPARALADADAEIATNVAGVVHLAALLLPHLRARARAALFVVGSGLAFAPSARVPVYCATKAFVHSWALGVRHQLRDTGVRVVEIIPPLVESDLHRDHDDPDNNKKAKNPSSLTMAEFMEGVRAGMDAGLDEIAVGSAAVEAKAWHETFDGPFARKNKT